MRLQEGSSWDLLSHAHTLSAAAVPSSPQMMQTQVKSDHRCTRATPFTLPNRIEVGQTVSSRLMLAFSLSAWPSRYNTSVPRKSSSSRTYPYTMCFGSSARWASSGMPAVRPSRNPLACCACSVPSTNGQHKRTHLETMRTRSTERFHPEAVLRVDRYRAHVGFSTVTPCGTAWRQGGLARHGCGPVDSSRVFGAPAREAPRGATGPGSHSTGRQAMQEA